MPSSELILWSDAAFHSPYALSVYVSLQEKGVGFTLRTLDLQQNQHTRPELSTLLMTGRIPCLQHDGFTLSESSAISEYLDECFPAPEYARLYPADRRQKAVARQIQAWLRSDFLAIRNERPTEVIFSGAKYPPLSTAARNEAGKLVRGALQLLGEKAYLFDQWSIADCDLAIMLNRLCSHGDPLPDGLRDYVALQWQRAGVQLWLNEAAKHNHS